MLEYIKENNASMYFSKSYNSPFKELDYFLNSKDLSPSPKEALQSIKIIELIYS